MSKEKQTEAEKCVCITSRCLKLVCKSRCNPREYCPEAIGKRLAEILHDKKANILISDLDGRELYEGSIGDLLFHLRYNPYDHLYDHLNKVYVSSMCVSNDTIHIVVEN